MKSTAVKVNNPHVSEVFRKFLEVRDPVVDLRLLPYIMPVVDVPYKMARWGYDIQAYTGNGTVSFSNLVVPQGEQWWLHYLAVTNATAGDADFDEVYLYVPLKEVYMSFGVPANAIVVPLKVGGSDVDQWVNSFECPVPMPQGSYIQCVITNYTADDYVYIQAGFKREGGVKV